MLGCLLFNPLGYYLVNCAALFMLLVINSCVVTNILYYVCYVFEGEVVNYLYTLWHNGAAPAKIR